MSVGEMSVGEMSVGEMSIGEMSVGEMSVGEMSWIRPRQAACLACEVVDDGEVPSFWRAVSIYLTHLTVPNAVQFKGIFNPAIPWNARMSLIG